MQIKSKSLIVILTLLVYMGCKKVDDTKKENVISDSGGISIKLEYTNDAPEPTDNTDLDLYIEDKENLKTILSSYKDGFDSVVINKGAINDGTYNVNVYVSEIERSTNCTLTFKGKNSGKTYSKKLGPLKLNDVSSYVKQVTLSIEDKKFTVN